MNGIGENGVVVRISAASCVRMRSEDGLRYLAEINLSRFRQGTLVVTPIGGGIEFHEGARGVLEEMGAVFERPPDLRLRLPVKSLGRFKEWFLPRIPGSRELDCLRELGEELCDEHGLPVVFSGDDVSHVASGCFERVSDNPRSPGMLTVYFQDLYDLEPDPEMRGLIGGKADSFDSVDPGGGNRLLWISAEEIREGRTRHGIAVSGHCGMLCRGG